MTFWACQWNASQSCTKTQYSGAYDSRALHTAYENTILRHAQISPESLDILGVLEFSKECGRLAYQWKPFQAAYENGIRLSTWLTCFSCCMRKHVSSESICSWMFWNSYRISSMLGCPIGKLLAKPKKQSKLWDKNCARRFHIVHMRLIL